MTRDPRVEAAMAFQKLSAEAFGAQRQRENADLEFQVPEKQWPEEVRIQRQGSTVNGVPIPARPMLSIPKLDQPIQLTYNQWQRAHYGVGIHPVSPEADDETAEVIQGLYRSIEVDSRAYIGRGWGLDRAIKAGFGAYRVNTVPDESTDDPFDQKIVIQRILRQASVYWDPFAVEPDFCDQGRCLIVSFMSRAAAKADWPKAKLSGMSSEELLELQAQMPNFARFNAPTDAPKDQLKWYDGANDTVCIAEFFFTEYTSESVAAPDDAKKTRTIKKPVIKWVKINAVEVLEEGVWNGQYIPIIPCIGKELQPFDAERRWEGMIGPNKDSARLFNYQVTAAVEKGALQTKAPWVGAVGQFKTNNAQWQLANSRNLPYLEYDPVTVAGNIAPPPHRNLESVDLSAEIGLIQVANENLQAGTAIFDPSLGRTSGKERSGIAIQAVQQQGDMSQSHFLANMADISMTYEAKVVLDLIPKIYDRPGRVARIIGENDDRREVMLNQPFVEGPNKRPMPVPLPQMPGMMARMGSTIMGRPPQSQKPPKTLHYDLTKGRYGVVVSVGKSYQTRAQEGSDALGELIKAIPETAPGLLPIWLKFQDFPGHAEAAEVMKKLQPPQLQQGEDADEDPAALQQKLQAQGQMLEEVSKMAQEQAKQIEMETTKEQAETQRQEREQGVKVELAQIAAARDVELARIKADNAMLLLREKARLDLRLQDDQQAHEAALARAEAGQAERMADQAHKQAEDLAVQQAALEPEPEAGAEA